MNCSRNVNGGSRSLHYSITLGKTFPRIASVRVVNVNLSQKLCWDVPCQVLWWAAKKRPSPRPPNGWRGTSNVVPLYSMKGHSLLLPLSKVLVQHSNPLHFFSNPECGRRRRNSDTINTIEIGGPMNLLLQASQCLYTKRTWKPEVLCEVLMPSEHFWCMSGMPHEACSGHCPGALPLN